MGIRAFGRAGSPFSFHMPSPSENWDARYRSSAAPLPGAPAAILVDVLPLLPRGRALDIACGPGRNALFLASNGWDVTAVDFSSPALDLACSAAQAASIPARIQRTFTRSQPRGLQLIEADLETVSLPNRSFDLIVSVNYLQRSLFRGIEDALRPGGAVLCETYTRDQLQFPDGPHYPEFLLHPGELRQAFPRLTILFYRELSAGKGTASVLARKTS